MIFLFSASPLDSVVIVAYTAASNAGEWTIFIILFIILFPTSSVYTSLSYNLLNESSREFPVTIILQALV